MPDRFPPLAPPEPPRPRAIILPALPWAELGLLALLGSLILMLA